MKVYKTITLKDGTTFTVTHDEPITTGEHSKPVLTLIAIAIPVGLLVLDYIGR